MSNPTIRTVGSYVAKWGEGPIWWKDRLYYVDIQGETLIRLDPESGTEETWEVGEPIGTIVPTESDALVYAGAAGFVRFDPESGEKTLLAANPETDNRFNDGKCDPAGRFWAGTISAKQSPDGALYCLEPDGQLRLKLSEVTNSNGLCWSADAETFFYIDTPTKAVRAYPYDQSSGAIAEPQTVIDTQAAGYDSSPDGMAIDSEGKLWIAFCHGGCVVRFDPATGDELMRLDFPAVETTACAFGGPKLDRLFVTTGLKSGADEPDGGKVFVVDGLGIRGVPAHPFGSG
ncbi:MAG: SMP-30/gluconolactonase/LRE family protein [Verrucomicrobiota bacterium]